MELNGVWFRGSAVTGSQPVRQVVRDEPAVSRVFLGFGWGFGRDFLGFGRGFLGFF